MMKIATFGAGCFWGVEAAFRELEGVIDTAVGFMGEALRTLVITTFAGKAPGTQKSARWNLTPGK